MDKLISKLKMLGYAELVYKQVKIFNNNNTGHLVIVDTKGNVIHKKYSIGSKVMATELDFYMLIECTTSFNAGIGIVITDDSCVYDMDKGCYVAEYEKVIIMTTPSSIMMYNKRNKKRYKFAVEPKRSNDDCLFTLDDYSYCKVVAEDKLLVGGTYVDFGKQIIVPEFRISGAFDEFILTSNREISLLGTDDEIISTHSNSENKIVMSSNAKFLIDCSNGEVYKILKVLNTYRNSQTHVMLENIITKEITKKLFDEATPIRWDSSGNNYPAYL